MIKSLAILIAFAVGPSIAVKAGVSVAQVKMELGANKNLYHFGDKVAFVLTFRNTSKQTLRIFPDPEQDDTRILSLLSFDQHTNPKPLRLGELSTYFDSWAKDIATVKPRQTCRQVVKAEFRNRLPADWKDSTPGIYLIFYGGTAFRLPGFGKYSLTATYSLDHEHPVLKYIPTTGPEVWFGKIESNSITLDFEK